jgi:hypothetical protein
MRIHEEKAMKIVPAQRFSFSHKAVWLGICLAASLSVPTFARAQQAAQLGQTNAAKQQVTDADKQGFPLQTSLDVQANATVGAVLLPPKITRKVFGKDIGDNYVAISLTVSNRSTKASLIVNSIFVDYSRWLLSGISDQDLDTKCIEALPVPAPAAPTAGAGQPPAPPPAPAKDQKSTKSPSGNALQSWQTRNCPAQISSIEYRIVRDQLLFARPYTIRNWVVRSLTLVGSIASAYTFPIGNITTVKGINAFSGVVVPAVSTFWPDDTIGQMNNISDLAFRVNKVIPAQSSDIIVAFYPMDRFLTPGLEKIFKSSPAVFFAPEAMLFDPEEQKQLEPLVDPFLNGHKVTEFFPYYPQIILSACDDPAQVKGDSGLRTACGIHELLHRVSLNTVKVVVGGTMTVDVDSVPAQINSVSITNSDGSAVDWTKAGDLKGVMEGSFLSGAQPQIAEAAKLGITNATAVTDGSTDTLLNFNMSIPAGMSISSDATNPTKLTFTAVKKDKQGASITSAAFEYTIPVAKAASPAADAQTPADSSATTGGAQAPDAGTPGASGGTTTQSGAKNPPAQTSNTQPKNK